MIRVAVKVRRVPHVDVRHLAEPHVVVGRHRVRWTPRYPSESLFPSEFVFPIGV